MVHNDLYSMKVTVYTINDCQFSQQEKAYLSAHNIAFEEKNLETNREYLTEMLAVSQNFAGTPVTKIDKDDGQSVVLKGFTQEEFDRELNLATPAVPAAPVVEPIPTAPSFSSSNQGNTAGVMPPASAPQPDPYSTPPASATPVANPLPPVPEPIAPPANDQLNSIISDLQAKANAATPVDTAPPPAATPMEMEQTPTVSAAPTDGMPHIPEPDFGK